MTDHQTALTERERIALTILDTALHLRSRQIGEAIAAARLPGGSNVIAIGATMCARLRRRGMVTYLPDVMMWRITSEGRAALQEPSA